MKILILFLFFISFPLLADTEWKVGETKRVLTKVSELGFVSKNCLKECGLKELVKKHRKKLDGMAITGGKDPASVLCKLMGAQVLYMSSAEDQETFCIKGEDVISLSLLLE